MTKLRFVVERHPECYIAYPLSLKGVVVAQGDTYKEALENAINAAKFHIETFGREVLPDDPEALEVFVEEVGVPV